MDRPKEAIERLRIGWDGHGAHDYRADKKALLEYLDWLEGKHVCEWPKELTRERLEMLADGLENRVINSNAMKDALRALAAIAPQRKKRVVNLWRNKNSHKDIWPSVFAADYDPNANDATEPWRCVARNVELED